MNKYIAIAVGLTLGTVTGVSLAIVGLRVAQQINPAIFPTGLGSCPVKNLTKENLVVKVISSADSSGTYYIEPQREAFFSCGDVVRVLSEGFTIKIKLTKPVAIHFAEKVKGVEL